MSAPPNTITTDQDMAIINACCKVFPGSFHMFDDWHLNMNQIKNVSGFLQLSDNNALFTRMKQGSDLLPRTGYLSGSHEPSPFDMVSKELFSLRRSNTPERYQQRRAEFEAMYFQSKAIPEKCLSGTEGSTGTRRTWLRSASTNQDAVCAFSFKGRGTQRRGIHIQECRHATWRANVPSPHGNVEGDKSVHKGTGRPTQLYLTFPICSHRSNWANLEGP